MHRNIFNDDSQNQITRTYAIVVYLPPHLDELIYPLREKFDPDYNKVPGHITIVFPFESALSFSELALVISRQLQDLSPFEVELESIGDFYPHCPVIYWGVRQSEQLQKLFCDLHTSLEIPLPFHRFVPHVTVANEISTHRVMLVKEKIVPYLPAEKFTVQSLDLIVPIAADKWVSVRNFSLEEKG